MNKKFIAGVVFILSSAVCAIIKTKADHQYLTEKAAQIVQDEKSTDDILAYNRAVDQISLKEEVLTREKKQLKDAFAAWKKEHNVDRRKKDIYLQEDKALKEFKKTFGYEESLEKLNREKQESIDAFKTSINYDEKLDELKEAIKDAESKWEDQQKLFSSADDDISDTANKLKHAAEDAKDAAVKKAKEQISEMEKQLKAEEDVWEKKIQKTRRDFEEKVNREKNRLHDKATKSISNLDAECDSAYKDLTSDIQGKRTDEEFDAITFYEDNCKLVKTHDEIDELRALDIFHNTPTSERLAWWLTEHKWPKACVAGGGLIPVVAVDFLIYRYIRFLLSILRSM